MCMLGIVSSNRAPASHAGCIILLLQVLNVCLLLFLSPAGSM